MRKAVTLAFAAVVLVAALAAGFIMSNFIGKETEAGKETNHLYTYPIGVPSGKKFTVTVETSSSIAPKVEIPESDSMKYIKVYFLGGNRSTLFFNATVPTDLLGGNLSLVWKYYLQEPDRYTLSSNNTHSSVYMTWKYDPFFSGSGYFEIRGTEAAW